MVEVNKVTHLLRQVTPFLREHHHVFATLGVIILGRDIALRLLIVNISLGDAQFLLHAQLYGQSMSIPTSLTLHLEALHGLIAVESILDASCQHVVNARVTIG